jgi:hypothetical protein
MIKKAIDEAMQIRIKKYALIVSWINTNGYDCDESEFKEYQKKEKKVRSQINLLMFLQGKGKYLIIPESSNFFVKKKKFNKLLVTTSITFSGMSLGSFCFTNSDAWAVYLQISLLCITAIILLKNVQRYDDTKK